MELNSFALFASLLGIVSGVFIVNRYYKYFRYLLHFFHLVFDAKYCDRLVKATLRPDFYYRNSNIYGLHDYEYHENAVDYSLPHVHDSIYNEYMSVIKVSVLKILLWCGAPIIIFALLGNGFAYLCSVMFAFFLLCIYELMAKRKSSGIKQTEYALIIRHIYAIASRQSDSKVTSGVMQSGTFSGWGSNSLRNNADYSTSKSRRKNLFSTMLSLFDSPLTWEKIWWGNDIALSVILVIIYWFTSSVGFSEAIVGAIQIVAITQLFFIPVWLIISITLRLLMKYH